MGTNGNANTILYAEPLLIPQKGHSPAKPAFGGGNGIMEYPEKARPPPFYCRLSQRLFFGHTRYLQPPAHCRSGPGSTKPGQQLFGAVAGANKKPPVVA